MEVITRAEALKLGLKNYYTGEPCKHGHISERYTVNTRCLDCINEYAQTKEFKEKRKQYNETYKSRNRNRKNENNRRYREKNKDRLKAIRDGNREELLKKRKEYYQQKLKHMRRIENLSEDQLEKRRAERRKWRKKDWEKYSSDPEYRCRHTIRNILYRTIKASKENKEARTHELLGYTHQQFKKHIERQFEKGMTWENHGDWHVDHIYPLSKFIEDGITDPKVINSLPNLKPIWKSENLSKGAKVIQLV